MLEGDVSSVLARGKHPLEEVGKRPKSDWNNTNDPGFFFLRGGGEGKKKVPKRFKQHAQMKGRGTQGKWGGGARSTAKIIP